jgi:hypothetical protein
MDLAIKHRPLFIFHPDERYYPINMTDYLDGVIYKNETEQIQHVTPNILHNKSNGSLVIQKSDNNPIIGGGKLKNTKLLTYIRKDNDFIYLIYMPFYSYNGASYVLGMIPAGEHQTDLENVIVILHKNNTSKPYKFVLSQHGDQIVYEPDDLLQQDGKYTIFVARGSHAHYIRSTNYARFLGYVYDVTGNGLHWFPDLEEVFKQGEKGFTISNHGYMTFKGNLGNEHVSSFPLQTFLDYTYNEEEQMKSSQVKEEGRNAILPIVSIILLVFVILFFILTGISIYKKYAKS